ncbi:MAG: PEP-CTERM sorting domain-containing protein [Nostoc sp. ChiQUE02]|uniref:PEP-CTERM sorting domain-containing protein n=1 Tax=Nostoc sp. ChiQUE02 TaxID=3075377 RepID=UPI002AD2012F|nr:PEP-CTERM sorting domain-containing protein [Nostoc sp. ChiQUE02]MDZ8233764.1 PEP-CTERM sorting domain-containing protein [Nostoc sp. ChiQUE02]
MKLQKVLLAMVTCSSIPFVFAVSSAQAADFAFNAKFSNGYSAKGSFTTKSGTPASFSEINPNFPSVPFTTQFLQSTSLSIFDSTNKLLQSGTGVSNGISTNAYLRLDYDSSLTNNLPALNVSTETPSQNPYYFIGNNVDPRGTSVAPGSTNYNLFLYDRTTDKYTFLGDTTSIKATAVPEPSSAISVLALAASGFGFALKRRLNQETKSKCPATNNI